MNTKKFLLLIFFLLFFTIVLFLIFTKNQKENEIKNNVNKKLFLPNLDSINPKEYPLLYDFINGSLGCYYNKNKNNFTEFGIYYAIAQNKNQKDIIFISSYEYSNEIIFPILGSKPIIETKFDNTIFNSWVKKLDKSRIYSENDWNIYIISLYENYKNESKYNFCDPLNNWAGLSLKDYKWELGLMYNKIFIDGIGWPTEWLKKYPFNKTVKKLGIDINNIFFNNYNINSVLTFKNKTGVELKVKIVQLDRYRFIWGKNNEEQEIYGLKNLKEFLKENNYE